MRLEYPDIDGVVLAEGTMDRSRGGQLLVPINSSATMWMILAAGSSGNRSKTVSVVWVPVLKPTSNKSVESCLLVV